MYWYVTGKWISTMQFISANSDMPRFIMVCCFQRKHLKRLWRGERGFLPEKFLKPKSAASVVSATPHTRHLLYDFRSDEPFMDFVQASIARYSGWQIAFTLWGNNFNFS